ncbi:MAG: hypothetical protein IJP00_05965 [Firmicutes bacterium]|nr:hypothetical protein [Bacillota bacterium]
MKKITAAVLTAALFITSIGMAHADTAAVPISAEIEAASIDFEITESISMHYSGNGNDLTITDIVITNSKAEGMNLEVSEVAAEPIMGWAIMAKETDFTKILNKKQFALCLEGHDLSSGPYTAAGTIEEGESLKLSFTGKAGAFSSKVSEKAANIVVTISLEEAAVPISTLPVGSSVYMYIDGLATEFIVIQQGNPNTSVYDSSCNGAWVLTKDILKSAAVDSSNNDYANSDIHTYLNSTFINTLHTETQAQVKSVKIPYYNGTGSAGSAVSGSSGLQTKAFLLSCYEVGWTTSIHSNFPVEGACLEYFKGCEATDEKRSANLNGTATYWWLRSPYTGNAYRIWHVINSGSYSYSKSTTSYGVRPALVLDSATKVVVNGDGNYEVKISTGEIPKYTFTVNGTTYQFNEGMTWASFYKSEYNPYVTGSGSQFYLNLIEYMTYMVDDSYTDLKTSDGTLLKGSDKIVAGGSYIT